MTKKQIEESSSPNDDGTFSLKGEDFIAGLVNDPEAGMTNAAELLKIHREVRADYVHRFLRAMRLKQKIQPRNIGPKDFEMSDQDDEYMRGRKQVIIDSRLRHDRGEGKNLVA